MVLTNICQGHTPRPVLFMLRLLAVNYVIYCQCAIFVIVVNLCLMWLVIANARTNELGAKDIVRNEFIMHNILEQQLGVLCGTISPGASPCNIFCCKSYNLLSLAVSHIIITIKCGTTNDGRVGFMTTLGSQCVWRVSGSCYRCGSRTPAPSTDGTCWSSSRALMVSNTRAPVAP